MHRFLTAGVGGQFGFWFGMSVSIPSGLKHHRPAHSWSPVWDYIHVLTPPVDFCGIKYRNVCLLSAEATEEKQLSDYGSVQHISFRKRVKPFGDHAQKCFWCSQRWRKMTTPPSEMQIISQQHTVPVSESTDLSSSATRTLK